MSKLSKHKANIGRKYNELLKTVRILEKKRFEIVRKYNALRRQHNYENDEELLRQYCIEVSPIYSELSRFWRSKPESFRIYYRSKTGKNPCFCHASPTDPKDNCLP